MHPTNPEEAADLAHLRSLMRSGAARGVRIAAGLSLGEAAAAAGVSASAVCRWEAQQRTPSGAAALRYGRLLARLLDTGGRRNAE